MSVELKKANLKRRLGSWTWRMNNLYWVVDKDGNPVLFKLNWAQRQLAKEMHQCNIILKARQLGFSTFILIFILDACLWSSHVKAGLVDVTLDDAKAKLGKIRFAYDRLPKRLKEELPLVHANLQELRWRNGSAVGVGTSHRGGTLQYLHVSEFGKICAKFPERAREIVTGALNTLQAGNLAFIESTAEGQEGRFYEMCEAAQAAQRRGDKLTPLDFKFHFYPWWKEPGYTLPADSAVIAEPMQRYFAKLEQRHAITLRPEQKAWYVKKRDTQLEDMKREYPATPEEAFEASVEGSVYAPWIEAAELDGRIGHFPAFQGVPVHSFWDIGRKDYTSIWFIQILVGLARVVGFYQNCMAGMPHYVEYCYGTEHARRLFPDFIQKGAATAGAFSARGWTRGTDYFPHDARVTEWGSDRTRLEQLRAAGFDAHIGGEQDLHDGINACRASFGSCQFDQAGCAEGLKMLRLYRWRWDEKLGAWNTREPRHDMASHGADAFRTFGTTWREVIPSLPEQPKPNHQVYTANPDGTHTVAIPDVRRLIELRKIRQERERA